MQKFMSKLFLDFAILSLSELECFYKITVK
jgi:hypothetical protein